MSRLDAVLAQYIGQTPKLFYSEQIAAVSYDGRANVYLHHADGHKAVVPYGNPALIANRMLLPGFWRKK
jgi:hypothetical protein